jgi:hypothetical protein
MHPGQVPLTSGEVTELCLLADPENSQREEAHEVDHQPRRQITPGGHEGLVALDGPTGGYLQSRTRRVIATANNPSLRAANRSML